jgi:hypothetical protein
MTQLELVQFIRSNRYAVLSSVSSAGKPQAAVIGIAATDSLEIVFDTVDTSRKFTNLCANPMVSLVIGGFVRGDERTVQYEGVADQPQGRELDRLKAIYYETFPEGKQRLGRQGLVYLRVRPSWIRYSDFNVNPPLIQEFDASQLADAVMKSTDGHD